jgi:hypothetical protein
MTKNIKKFAGFISTVLILLVCTFHTNAQLIINMNQVDIQDTIYTCESVYGMFLYPDSRITQNSMWIISKIEGETWMGSDTIYGDTISYFDPFTNGYVSQQGSDGTNLYGTKIEVRPLVLNTGYIGGECNSDVQLKASTNYSGDGTVNYSWDPAEYLSNAHIPNPIAIVTGSTVFNVTLSTPTGCTMTKNIEVIVNLPEAPSICMVSVDSATNKNILFWETPASSGIDSVFVYRETDITNEYKKIGSLGINNPGSFIDFGSFPLVQSNKYVLAVLDSCGSTSAYSVPHKTIHLSINQGQNDNWNLIWEPYIGFDVSTYRIYRGTAEGVMALIGTTSGSSTQYTDFSAPLGNVLYQIEVINPTVCNISGLKSTQVVLNKSRSNIASNWATIVQNPKLNNSYSIYPNPFRTSLHIESAGTNRHGIIELTGPDGKIIKRIQFNSGKIDIDGNRLKTGIYIMNIKSGNETSTHIIIKE